VQALPEGLNHPEELTADNGYFSEHNVEVCEAAGSVPLIAMKRDDHHPYWSARFSEPTEVPPEATSVERMAH
jgi:IS5 family transposase